MGDDKGGTLVHGSCHTGTKVAAGTGPVTAAAGWAENAVVTCTSGGSTLTGGTYVTGPAK